MSVIFRTHRQALRTDSAAARAPRWFACLLVVLYKFALILVIAEAGFDGGILKGEESEAEIHQAIISARNYQRTRPNAQILLQTIQTGLSNTQVRSFESHFGATPICHDCMPYHIVRGPPLS